MPELPEVETLTRAVRRVLKGRRLLSAEFLRADLRDPIPAAHFRELFEGEVIEEVLRRSKYMLIKSRKGYGIFHLGMTGNMLYKQSAVPDVAHTHAVFRFEAENGASAFLHFIDPRRFGRIACVEGAEFQSHDFFADLGPEPLECKTLGAHLFQKSRGKKQPIKPFLMDSRIVVGVGNIYAAEALHKAGISPLRKAGEVSRAKYAKLATQIKKTLEASIKAGGTTFRDFKNSDGNPGYFAVKLFVYDREGEKCKSCGKTIKQVRQAGRSTFYCPGCQN